jgi:hypothetical protein
LKDKALDRAFKQQATEQQHHCCKKWKWDVDELDDDPPESSNRYKPRRKESDQGNDGSHRVTVDPSLSLKAIGTGHAF